MIFSLFLTFIAVFLTGISQVLLKIGSYHQNIRSDSISDAYLNFYTLFAYGLLLVVTMISVIALKEVPLKVFYAITSLGFVVVVGLSSWVLKEEVTKNMVAGVIAIFFGVFLFNLSF